jgi:hypothetical protein
MIGLLPALWLAEAGAREPGKKSAGKPAEAATCGDHGTAVKFEPTPSDAAKRAIKEQKLVFVLHVSGEFEDPDFT